MNKFAKGSLIVATIFSAVTIAAAEDTPQHERHELMESVGDAAKPLGGMLRGKVAFDEALVRSSLTTWHEVSESFGELFPAGSESGEGTEAAPAIWEDRAGFDAALSKWNADIEEALDADLSSMATAGPMIGKVFKNCKGCHDTYRIEDE